MAGAGESSASEARLNADGMSLLPEGEAKSVAEAFDLAKLPASFYADPYPTYHALRMFDPVRQMPDGSYFLTRHRDLEQVYKDTVTFSSDKKKEFGPKYGDSYLFRHHTTSLVFNDPPLHTRVRKIMAGALTPRAVVDMEAPVTRLVE
jgi:cytochrome P450